jgi:glycolate oxidase iron-sulfur subunit
MVVEKPTCEMKVIDAKETAASTFDRIMRATLAQILPFDKRFRFAMKSARLVKPLAPLMPSKIRNMVDFAPKKIPVPSLNDKPQVFPAEGKCIKRVALMTGCAQKALDTDINAEGWA